MLPYPEKMINFFCQEDYGQKVGKHAGLWMKSCRVGLIFWEKEERVGFTMCGHDLIDGPGYRADGGFSRRFFASWLTTQEG
jgi:hypothetical protein